MSFKKWLITNFVLTSGIWVLLWLGTSVWGGMTVDRGFILVLGILVGFAFSLFPMVSDKLTWAHLVVGTLIWQAGFSLPLLINHASHDEVICVPENELLDRMGDGFFFTWHGEKVAEYYRVSVDGSTMWAWVMPDTARLLELHRIYQNQDALEAGARKKFHTLLETPIPRVDTTASLSCQRCALEPFLDQMRQRAESLIPGVIISLDIRRDAIRGL
ncbi:MAG: hypothetical protein WCV85_06160 [Patescibacteria group bacterium]